MRRILNIRSTFLVLLCGCTAHLAPDYDQSVYDGLVSANKDIQALFVAIGNSTTNDTYPPRAAAYDHIIAELEAVELLIKARPLPDPAALAETNKVLASLHIGEASADPNFSEYPSARSVALLVGTIQHMQTSDRTTGLQPSLLAPYKNQAMIYLTQAITYESFLKR